MSDGLDRRRAPRQDTMGLIVYAMAEGQTTASAPAYTIGDLSPLGALLVGKVALPVGQTTQLRLEVPGDRAIEVQATVARSFELNGDTRVGVQFVDLDDQAQAFIQEAILSEIVRDAEPVVLVVAGGVGQAIDLWADLDEVGCDARVVPSLDEGFVALHARDLPVSTILVDVREGSSSDTVAFAEYARSNMPKARLMLFGVTDDKSPVPGVECVPTSAWSVSERMALFGTAAQRAAGRAH